ncbi:MAG: MgtC/SapB family protein [Phycisphaerales bacterium]
MQDYLHNIISLLISVILGGFIGAEREYRGKAAGLRTNILICLGSCLFTIISTSLAGAEPGRIAAQVVTGIGFLGAGAIIHSGIGIQGLTTAAGIWIVASIGMACGAKMYLLAGFSAFLSLLVLLFLPFLERQISKNHPIERNLNNMN